MIVILAEKPSVAKEIAAVFNGKTHDGHFFCEGPNFLNDDVHVTYAFGHLLKIANQIPQPWSLSSLPLFPDFDYTVNDSAKKQLAVISKLVKAADKVYIATDCGREGELIARLILNHCKWNQWNNTYRFWTSEFLSPEVIKRELLNAAPSSKYDGLYSSSLARQHADWLVGINLTVATSVTAGGVYSVGRVQTPVVKLICDRDLEINNFVSKTYYTVEGVFLQEKEYVGKLIQEDPEEYYSLDKVNEIIEKLSNIPVGEVIDVLKKKEERFPPVLHSLTSLQQEANELYGFSAAKTLELAQDLYEKKKCISYPRTDSNYLSEGSVSMVEELISKFKLNTDVPPSKVGKRLFDDSKLTDHYALIPLAPLNGGTEDEVALYNLIFRRFRGAFLLPYVIEKTTALTEVKTSFGEFVFKTTGNVDVQMGWKSLYKEEVSEEKESKLPTITKGLSKVNNYLSVQKKTNPPKHFTESTLLNKMESLGLGQPATRADVIEKILKRSYVGRNKKNVVCLEKGFELIKQVGERDFSDPELTALWETKLSEIAAGKYDYNSFINETKEFTTNEVQNVSNKTFVAVNRPLPPKMLALGKDLAKKHGVKLNVTNFEELKAFIDRYISLQPEIGKCKCGKDIKESLKAFSCDCGRIIWKESMGRKFNKKEAAVLLSGNSIKIDNFKNKEGKVYSATIVLNDKIEFVK